MSGRRRVQRSVRITVAALVLGVAAVGVVLALATSTGVRSAALAALIGGVIASRILYTEVVQTRQQGLRDRASQARSFASSLAAARTERLQYAARMAERIQTRDWRISDLQQRLRSTESRLQGAETRLKGAETRLEREARRADDAHHRMNALLDQVLARVPAPDSGSTHSDLDQTDLDEAETDEPDLDEAELESVASDRLPSVVELLTWEAGASARQRSWRREA